MRTIERILNGLSNSDQVALRYAFEVGTPDKYIEYEPGRFIGVNITRTDLQIEQRAGYFAEGMLTAHTVKFPVTYSAYAPFEEQTDETRRRDDMASDEDDRCLPYKSTS